MVEAVVECLPQRELVSPLDLVEESVDAGDGLALVVATEDNHLFWETALQREKQADYLTALLATVHVVTKEEILQISAQNLFLLLLLVLVSHLLEHVKEVAVLTVDVAEDLDGSLELEKWLLVLENLLRLLKQIVDNLLWQIDEWHIFRVLLFVVHYFIIQIEDNHIHYELLFVSKISFGYLLKTFFELFAPYFLDVQRFSSVLIRLEVAIEKSLQSLAVGLLAQALFLNGREVLP